MRAALVLGILALAGCIQPAAPLDATSASVEPAALPLAAWDGAKLAGERSLKPALDVTTCLVGVACPEPDVACTPKNCERRAFDVAVPPGFDGQLAVALRWPTDHSLWFTLKVEDARGKVVAVGRYGYLDHLSSLALVDKPASGPYTAVVALAAGAGSYQAAASLLPSAKGDPSREMLPDIVTLAPTDLRIAAPDPESVGPLSVIPGGAAGATGALVGAKGCGVDELAAGARRCLRFGNAVGNIGEGPLDIRLALPDAAPGGRFVQRIHKVDGSFADSPAGTAEFHPIHAHWHNAGASEFTVYRYDNATATRGDAVSHGRKTGICFADVGLVTLTGARMATPVHDGRECYDPVPSVGWTMGLQPGWFDLYDWVVADQYVDISGVADGTYALCSRANPQGTLKETTSANNEACTTFALTGDTVAVLSPQPYHKAPS